MPSIMNHHHHQHHYRLLEIRLFYVRISPCSTPTVPSSLSLHISGRSLTLRRDRLDPDSAEVTYVTTDPLRVSSAADFEVSDEASNLILCGSLERVEAGWSNGTMGGSDGKDPGWSMDCYVAASVAASGFVQPKMGIANPSIDVYVAGCFGGIPLILTQTVQMSPRRKAARPGALHAIPEDEEGSSRERRNCEGTSSRGPVPPVRSPSDKNKVPEGENDDGNDSDTNVGPSYYPEGWYVDEDGELSWFNAGVRVGVGIGLGMCVGLGIGVGLLMRSYQATTRTFKRRFF
ncbi:uncharacterized protein M6B38_373175 [Iris pallida]|uniref:Uncharacterized protein n=1 Tax=Iris pallida TaxID=29817 RepID=A0AAX6GDI1_IRIPA|nr:uncharacterized protein M6B38_373175 [Iris pallida]